MKILIITIDVDHNDDDSNNDYADADDDAHNSENDYDSYHKIYLSMYETIA